MLKKPSSGFARLWAAVNRPAAAAKGRPPRPWLKPSFTRAELAAWLSARAISPGIWRCEYQAPGCLNRGRFLSAADISLDHRQPLAGGGLTTLENLAITCQPCNHLKRDTSEVRFLALVRFLADWPPDEAKSVWGRLRQSPGAWVQTWRSKR